MTHAMRTAVVLSLVGAILILVGLPAGAGDDRIFPQAWAGVWKGDLVIHHAGNPDAQTVPMTLTIAAREETGRWRFAIKYGEQRVREYVLVEIDRAAGRYMIDEGNSIKIPATFVGGELVTDFAVVGSHMIIGYRLVGDILEFRTRMGTVEPTGRTGGEDGAPTVLVFGVKGVQRASLKRE